MFTPSKINIRRHPRINFHLTLKPKVHQNELFHYLLLQTQPQIKPIASRQSLGQTTDSGHYHEQSKYSGTVSRGRRPVITAMINPHGRDISGSSNKTCIGCAGSCENIDSIYLF